MCRIAVSQNLLSVGGVFPNTIDVLDLEQRCWFSRTLRSRFFPREQIECVLEYRESVLLLGGVRVEHRQYTFIRDQRYLELMRQNLHVVVCIDFDCFLFVWRLIFGVLFYYYYCFI